jgi:Flp pilus assembly protein TadD
MALHASPFAEGDWRGKASLLAFMAVAFLGAAVYLVTLPYELVWDDNLILKQTTETVRDHGIVALFTTEFLPEASVGYYRPIVQFSFWLDSRLAGANPHAFHLTNILLHAVNGGLVFLMLRLVLASGTGAFLGATLFALHPAHSESVAFVSGRTDLWAALFILVAANLWLWERREPGTIPLAKRAGATAAFLLACLSKETAYLLPVVLLAWDGLMGAPPGATTGFRGWMRRNAGWAAAWGGAAVVTLLLRWFLAGVGSPGGVPNAPLTFIRLWMTYARLLVIPWPLRYYYREADLDGWLSIVPAAIVLGGCLWAARRSAGRAGLLALAWMAIFLLPVAGPMRPSGAPLAERFLYLPSVGFCLLAGHILGVFTRTRIGRSVTYPLAVSAAVAMVVIILGQVPTWKDNLTLHTTLVKACPDVFLTHFNLAGALKAVGRPEEAISEYRKTIALMPNYYDAHFNLGNSLKDIGRLEEAVTEYRAVISINPTYHDAYLNLGQAYDLLSRPGEAEEAYRRLIAERPDDFRAYANLGHTLGDQDRWAEALESFRTAARLKPDDALLRFNAGIALSRLGRAAEAIAEYRAAVGLGPGNSAARLKLGTALLEAGDVAGARSEAAALERLDPPKALDLRRRIGP